jgi:hypothetical protein
MATYLQLPVDMGGTRFGPFQGVVYIGSDPSRCQIVLDAKLGVFAVHCVLTETGPGAYTASATQRGLKLFLIQKGEKKPWPIEQPVQAKPGDQIVLASETGPRFVIEHVPGQSLATPGGPQAAGGADSSNLGSGIANEMSRRMQAQLIAKNPVFRTLYQLKAKFKPGFWKSPYFIVSTLGAVGAALLGGVATCSGVLYKLIPYF